MLICLIGTGGTGKSTLARRVEEELRIKYVPTPTRKVPAELRCTEVGQRMVLQHYYEMFESLTEDSICDRSVLDVIAYSMAYECWDKEEIQREIERYKESSIYPDLIFYLPIEFPMKSDGDRETFEAKRIAVDEAIMEIFYCNNIVPFVLRGTVEERLDILLSIIKCKSACGGD